MRECVEVVRILRMEADHEIGVLGSEGEEEEEVSNFAWRITLGY